LVGTKQDGIFIATGIRKHPTLSGITALVVFVCCSLFFFIIPTEIKFYSVTPCAKQVFCLFMVVNRTISEVFHFWSLHKIR